MATTRQRKAKAAGSAAPNSSKPSTAPIQPPTTSASAPAGMPSLLTRAEVAFLLIFPLTMVAGSLFSSLSPAARAAPYSADLQAHPAAVAPSYFARKDNVLNAYFVKIGWFWVTLGFSTFLSARLLTTERALAPAQALRAVLRYSALTAWWFATTQSFFGGPPLIDRGFRWTGGACAVGASVGGAAKAGGGQQMRDIERLVSAAACRAVGGRWRGGHDVSGHAFLLVTGTAFLGFEVLPGVLARWRAAGTEGESDKTKSGGKGDKAKSGGDGVSQEDVIDLAEAFVGVIALLNWWMLLMTAAYFHTWFEKLTGLITAFVGIGAVYILPRLVPVLAMVFGTPSLG